LDKNFKIKRLSSEEESSKLESIFKKNKKENISGNQDPN
jgi:hypothetical protein